MKRTPDGFLYPDPAQYREFFAADLPEDQAVFNAKAQVLIRAENFGAVIASPAWRATPSWMVAAGADKTINPDHERRYAKGAAGEGLEVDHASHSVSASRPRDVADVIERAAATSAKPSAP